MSERFNKSTMELIEAVLGQLRDMEVLAAMDALKTLHRYGAGDDRVDYLDLQAKTDRQARKRYFMRKGER